MKTKIKKGFFYLALGFVLFFCLRLGYGYLVPTGTSFSNADQRYADGFITAELARKNYATEKMKFDDGASSQAKSADQKYEKVGALQAKTAAFAEDEKKLRDLIKKYNAQVQFEQSSGLSGSRRLNLAIGVQPLRFDNMVDELKTINSSLLSIQINKTDKTNEYKDLNVKRVSLEKTRDGLIALKSKGGRVDELINLESKILEIETDLQETGVKLGEYDAENEFCTIKYALYEQGNAQAKIAFLFRVRVALLWTIKYYVLSLAVLLAGALTILIAVLVLDKLKMLHTASGGE